MKATRGYSSAVQQITRRVTYSFLGILAAACFVAGAWLLSGFFR